MSKILFIFLISVSMQSFAQDSLVTKTLENVVIIGTRFDLPVARSGKVIYNYRQAELSRMQGRTVGELLNDVPSIQMDGIYGSPGTNLNYYARAGRSKNTLILLDGVPMMDPTGIDQFYDLRFISMNQINSVEVLQGALSTLYGSGASASVVNIRLKEPVNNGLSGSVGASAGNWNSFGQDFSVTGKYDKASFLVMGNLYSTVGFSSALDTAALKSFDTDGIKNRNGLIKFGYKISSQIDFDLFSGYDAFDADFDSGAFIDGADAQKQKQFRYGGHFNWHHQKGELKWTSQLTNIEREFSGSFPSAWDGQNIFSELTNTIKIFTNITSLSGLSFHRLQADLDSGEGSDVHHFYTLDPYTSVFVAFGKGIDFHGGIRLNYHSAYKTKLLYNLNPSWILPVSEESNLKIFASASSAYITPSLFQLFSPWGNTELLPEESFNYEYGIGFYNSEKLQMSAVNFFRKEINPIGFSSSYVNLADEQLIKGITVTARMKLNKMIRLGIEFSHQSADQELNLYRIPKVKAGGDISLSPFVGNSITLRYSYTGERKTVHYYFDPNFNFVSEEIDLTPYQLIDLNFTQDMANKKLQVFGSINNLLDEKFTGIYGYTTRGRNFVAGLRISFQKKN